METSRKQTQNIQSKIIQELEEAPAVKYIGWNEFELTMLRKYYGRKETSAIARVLGKTIQAIYNKAQHLGLKYRNETLPPLR